MQPTIRPLILIVLDGWGYTDNTVYNAIYSAKTPFLETLWGCHPHTLIQASGTSVGLPENQMGNSEVGHMTIGTGRLVDQQFSRITDAIKNGSFYKNDALNSAFQQAAGSDKAVHILGPLSPGGVHGHQDHIFSLLELAAQRNVNKIYLHAFLDGRDSPQKSAAESILLAQLKMKSLGRGKFASMIGRFYAMDRNKHWDRTQKAYDLISCGKADYHSDDPLIALDFAYDRRETDEFVSSTAIIDKDEMPVQTEDGDVIVFANYRADRARQLARAFTKKDFKNFKREKTPQLGAFISFTEYKANYEFPVAFPPIHLDHVFGEYISALGLKQLRIAETEKYAHVTFFFNGGEERAFAGEDRILVPSPHVHAYNTVPEMSAFEITDNILKAMKSDQYDAIICNYANADMVGHTGDFQATIKAIETLDQCLEKLVQAAQKIQGEVIITADHGNAEQMKTYATEKVKSDPYTAHTTNLVPFIYVGRNAKIQSAATGSLADIAPTMLYLMGFDIPQEMTGKSLLSLR